MPRDDRDPRAPAWLQQGDAHPSTDHDPGTDHDDVATGSAGWLPWLPGPVAAPAAEPSTPTARPASRRLQFLPALPATTDNPVLADPPTGPLDRVAADGASGAAEDPDP